MAIPATQIRRGMVIVFEGEPCRVVEFRHHTPGNLRAMIQTKLRSIRTGSSFEHRFRSVDTIEKASLEQHEMEYLYSDGSHHHFMNTETFEQIALSDDDLGDAAQWLTPGLKIQVEFYEGTPIGIDLPPSLELTVTQTEPSLKGATVSNVNKPATLETGVTIQAGTSGHDAFAVWLNGRYLGSTTGTAAQVLTVPAGAVRAGTDNVLAVLVENMAHDQDRVADDSYSKPRGVQSAVIADSTTPITWRLRGTPGADHPTDAVRGQFNNGGLHGEWAGYHLPGYPDGGWSRVTLPHAQPQPGVAWYRSTFPLALPPDQHPIRTCQFQ